MTQVAPPFKGCRMPLLLQYPPGYPGCRWLNSRGSKQASFLMSCSKGRGASSWPILIWYCRVFQCMTRCGLSLKTMAETRSFLPRQRMKSTVACRVTSHLCPVIDPLMSSVNRTAQFSICGAESGWLGGILAMFAMALMLALRGRSSMPALVLIRWNIWLMSVWVMSWYSPWIPAAATSLRRDCAYSYSMSTPRMTILRSRTFKSPLSTLRAWRVCSQETLLSVSWPSVMRMCMKHQLLAVLSRSSTSCSFIIRLFPQSSASRMAVPPWGWMFQIQLGVDDRVACQKPQERRAASVRKWVCSGVFWA